MTKPVRVVVFAVIAAALVTAGFFYYEKFWAAAPQEKALEGAGGAAETIKDTSTKGTLPDMDLNANPLGNVREMNPAAKTNPFSGIKTNPFK